MGVLSNWSLEAGGTSSSRRSNRAIGYSLSIVSKMGSKKSASADFDVLQRVPPVPRYRAPKRLELHSFLKGREARRCRE